MTEKRERKNERIKDFPCNFLALSDHGLRELKYKGVFL